MNSVILFLACNRLDYNKLALERYVKNTPETHRLIIADNGSVDGTREYLKDLEQSGFLKGQAEYWYFKKNFGKERVRAYFLHKFHNTFPYLGFVANDVYVSPGWLTDFERTLKADPKVGIVGPVDREWDKPTREIDGTPHYFEDEFYWSDGYWLLRSRTIREIKDTVRLPSASSLDKGNIANSDQVTEAPHSIPHPGYFVYNSFARSQEWYWNAIRATGYETVCNSRHRQEYVWVENPGPWHRNYTILTKVAYCRDQRLYEQATAGTLEYECSGQVHYWHDEPEIIRTMPEWLWDQVRDGRLAQLDGIHEDPSQIGRVDLSMDSIFRSAR